MFEGLLQPMHLILIAIIAIIFLGPKRLPELGKGLGEGIRGFRDAFSGNNKADPPAEPQKKIEP
jgi:sec-independent protein translocase protein TatA